MRFSCFYVAYLVEIGCDDGCFSEYCHTLESAEDYLFRMGREHLIDWFEITKTKADFNSVIFYEEKKVCGLFEIEN